MDYCISKDLLDLSTYQVHNCSGNLIGTIDYTRTGAYKATSRINGKTQFFRSIALAASWLFKNSSVKPEAALQYSMFD